MTKLKPNTNQLYDRTAVNMGNIQVKKILILAANPRTTARLQLEQEVREIEEGLRRSIHRNQFEIHSKWAVRPRDIRQALLDYEPNIVHFTGHGNKDGLLVEDELGMAVRFSAKALSELFKLCASHVECVILNACYSAPQATAINKHIDYVIGMKKAIKDSASVEFSVGFYDALGAGRCIEDAFAFGRAAILAQLPDLPDYNIPILKTRRESEMVKIKVCIETTGNIFDANASHDMCTAALKKRLIDELKLSKTFEDGMPIPYYLLNKTRDTILDDTKNLRENGVRDNDVFVFLVETDDE